MHFHLICAMCSCHMLHFNLAKIRSWSLELAFVDLGLDLVPWPSSCQQSFPGR